MNRSQDEFWHNSLAYIVQMIDMYGDETRMRAAAMQNETYSSKYFDGQEAKKIKSMKEAEGWC
jgi:hypothetical protein